MNKKNDNDVRKIRFNANFSRKEMAVLQACKEHFELSRTEILVAGLQLLNEKMLKKNENQNSMFENL